MNNLNPLKRVKKAFGLDADTRFSDVLPSDLYDDFREVEPETVDMLMQLFAGMEQFNSEAKELCANSGVSERHLDIQKQFQQILQDIERMSSDKEDDRNWFMRKISKFTEAKRGDVAEQMENIKKTAAEVVRDVAQQVKNERQFVDGYYEVHLATREAKVLMEEARVRQNKRYEDAAEAMRQNMEDLKNHTPGTVEFAQAELKLSESQLQFNRENARRSSAEGLTNGLTETVAMCEAMLMHLRQTTSTKEELYRQTGHALNTTQTSFTLMTMGVTSQKGMMETTRSIEQLNDGREKTMKMMAVNNVAHQERALKAAHSKTVDPAVLKQLTQSVLMANERLAPLREELMQRNRKSAEDAAEIADNFKHQMVEQASKRALQQVQKKVPAALAHLSKDTVETVVETEDVAQPARARSSGPR